LAGISNLPQKLGTASTGSSWLHSDLLAIVCVLQRDSLSDQLLTAKRATFRPYERGPPVLWLKAKPLSGTLPKPFCPLAVDDNFAGPKGVTNPWRFSLMTWQGFFA